MSVRAVLGCMYGDEAKAKMVDYLAAGSDVVVRFQGGSNAGHTIWSEGRKYVLHLIPSGILYPGKLCVIGSGVILDPLELLSEMKTLSAAGISFENRLIIDPRAAVILKWHRQLDQAGEEKLGSAKIGTTGKGIGPGYADAISRVGIRLGDLMQAEYLEKRLNSLARFHGFKTEDIPQIKNELTKAGQELAPFIKQVPYLMEKWQQEDKNILFEGAQGSLLDVTFGTYPYVTSSHVTAGGIAAGSGISPSAVDEIVGVYKSYYTRVGEGPFPTELHDKTGDSIREKGHEFGATTGRPRRCGWFDAVSSRYTALLNGINTGALTLLDVLGEQEILKICVAYKKGQERITQFPAQISNFEGLQPEYLELPGWQEDISQVKEYKNLPANAQNYVETIENLLSVKMKYISVGADRHQTIVR